MICGDVGLVVIEVRGGKGFRKRVSVLCSFLIQYAIDWALIALELIRIFNWTSSIGNGDWSCVPVCWFV